tara:strand:+ start:524 stop:1027 length:504 start_codon:yes stop_codon:yes gene_type:complete
MKYLNIIRHGDAEAQSLVKKDFLRNLTDNGEKDLRLLDQHLIKYDFKKHKIICSASLRTKQTLDSLKMSLNPESKVFYSNDIYLGTFKTLLSYIMLEENNAHMLTIIAHNPGVSDLLSYITGEYETRDMGTSTIASVIIDCKQSRTLEGSGRLQFYVQSKNNIIIDL